MGGDHSLWSFKATERVRAKTYHLIYVPFENTMYLVPWIQIRQVSPKPSVGDTSTHYLVIYYSQKLSWTLDSPTWPPFYSYYFSSGRFRETFAKLLSDEIIEEPSFLPLQHAWGSQHPAGGAQVGDRRGRGEQEVPGGQQRVVELHGGVELVRALQPGVIKERLRVKNWKDSDVISITMIQSFNVCFLLLYKFQKKWVRLNRWSSIPYPFFSISSSGRRSKVKLGIDVSGRWSDRSAASDFR